MFWIGQYFGWLHPAFASTQAQHDQAVAGRSPVEPSYTPNAAYDWLDAFTRAGISVWPIVWLNGESAQAKGPKVNGKDASEIAQYLNGQATVCDRDLAACLKNKLEKSSHGWIARIAGPEVDWPPLVTAKYLHL